MRRYHGATLAIVTAVNLKLGCWKVCGVKCQSCTEDAQRGGEKDLMFIALRLDIDLKCTGSDLDFLLLAS